MRASTCETSAWRSQDKPRQRVTKPTSACLWPPKSEPGCSSPATYDVFVSVGTPTGTPKIALPLPDDDGHHRYRLGKLIISSANR